MWTEEQLRIKEKRERLERLSATRDKVEGLPHKYGWKFYRWAREFWDSNNRMTLLCAANQISKSSIQIRKCIEWATNPELWPDLWVKRPYQFWYLYPNLSTATIEFEKKWVPEFMPKGSYKNSDPQTGWKAHYGTDKNVHAIHFNSGVSVYFKAYSQKARDLQTATVDAIFADEELPSTLYPELMVRLAATEGYFHMVFTATLGQEFWRCAIEEKGTKLEKFPSAKKIQVSMYDCLEYEDGSQTPWSVERIGRVVAQCGSENEVQKRVWGRFVVDEGLLYPMFNRKLHCRESHPLPSEWSYYAAVDYGTGGKYGHPAAIVFVALNPRGTQGRVFRCWRGDNVETTASDIWDKFREIRGNTECVLQIYDHAAKDFGTITSRLNESFTKAEKGLEIGRTTLGTLFRNNMLLLYEDDPEIQKLIQELCSVTKDSLVGDDLTDALRYCVTLMPWNWAAALAEGRGIAPDGTEEQITAQKPPKKMLSEREEFRQNMKNSSTRNDDLHALEFEEINEFYGN